MPNTVIKGPSLLKQNPNPVPAPMNGIIIFNERGEYFCLTIEQLTRSLLCIGAPGFGKTVALLQIAQSIRELCDMCSNQNILVFFDTKGDYMNRLYRPGDIVIDPTAHGADDIAIWNIFEELLADGNDPDEIYDNAYEMATLLCADKLKNNSANPFFPKAGRDVLMGLLYSIAMQGTEDSAFRANCMNNQYLKDFFRCHFSQDSLAAELQQYPATQSIMTSFYTGDGTMSPQSMGVLAEAVESGREIFKRNFGAKGQFSIRNAVRKKGNKAIFIEYDLAKGSTLTPIYRALCDLVLKESMSRGTNAGGGHVYLFVDEMSLCPAKQLSLGINFGRGMGLSVIAGIQNVEQIEQIYGEKDAQSLLTSFGTTITFNTPSAPSRKMIQNRCGTNLKLDTIFTAQGRGEQKDRIASVVEDWDIADLPIGQAIIHTLGTAPYRFTFPNR